MNVFDRGLQLYLLLLAVVSAVTAVWGVNRFVLGNTTAATGWAVLIGIASALVLVGLLVRYLRSSPDRGRLTREHPW